MQGLSVLGKRSFINFINKFTNHIQQESAVIGAVQYYITTALKYI